MGHDDDLLLKLASSISDGGPIDWESSSGSEGEARAVVDRLRSLAGIAELHRRPARLEIVPPLRRFGHLEILESVGTGTFGEVFRARDVRLDRIVALKVLRPAPAGGGVAESPGSRALPPADAPPGDFHDQVLREGRHMARVRHPNVISVYGAEIDGGQVGLWMEFVNGRTLAELVEEQGRLSASEAAAIGIVLCRALAAIHAADLLHLDVKPRNVMREEGGRIVVMDFGMGHDLSGQGGAQVFGGTPVYMAPERLEGGPPTKASDIYSLGVTLYFLVTGSHPVEGPTLDALYRAHEKGEKRRLRDVRPDLPGAFVQVVERATDRDPARRFSSTGEMEAALAAALEEGTTAGPAPVLPRAIPAKSEAPPPGAVKDATWSRRILLAGLSLAVAILLWTAYRSLSRPEPSGGDAVTRTETGPAGPADGGATSDNTVLSPPGNTSRLNEDFPTPSGPAAPVSLPTAAGAFTVLATFQRGAAGHPLVFGDRVSVGDSLSLDVRTSEPLFVYVINEDDKGQAYLLFPLPGFTPSNPVAPAGPRVLPGVRGGKRYFWQVTSAGGREHFLVVASRERLVELEADLLSLTQPQAGAKLTYPRLSESSLVRLRGVGGLVEAPNAAPAEGVAPLFELAAALPAGPDTSGGVWIRRLDLENPSR